MFIFFTNASENGCYKYSQNCFPMLSTRISSIHLQPPNHISNVRMSVYYNIHRITYRLRVFQLWYFVSVVWNQLHTRIHGGTHGRTIAIIKPFENFLNIVCLRHSITLVNPLNPNTKDHISLPYVLHRKPWWKQTFTFINLNFISVEDQHVINIKAIYHMKTGWIKIIINTCFWLVQLETTWKNDLIKLLISLFGCLLIQPMQWFDKFTHLMLISKNLQIFHVNFSSRSPFNKAISTSISWIIILWIASKATSNKW